MGFVEPMQKRANKNALNQNAFSVVQAVTGAEGPFVVKPPSSKGRKATAGRLAKKARRK
jgi:hypothetical protein